MSRRTKKKLEFLDHSVYTQRDYSIMPYKERQDSGTGLNNTIQLTATYNIANSVIVASNPSPSHLAEAYVKARARLAEKVNAMSVNLAQAGGERRQTADLLVSTANRIVGAARALRHGRLREFVTALELPAGKRPSAKEWERVTRTPVHKRLANHWLEYQYGWKPLLQDAFGVAELLSSHLATDRYNIGSRSSGSAELVATSGDLTTTRTWLKKQTRTRMSLTYRLEDAGRAVLAQTGISNPALLAWELLPYSFVVDWFVPIGNYLQALDAFNGFTFVSGWVVNSTKQEYSEYRNSAVKSWSGNIWTITTILHASSSSRSQYNRTRLSGFPPVGKLTIHSPVGGDPVNRFYTAAALLTQLFK
jgi:hypothetical protein